MKRVLALFLVLICMLSVVACDKATGSGEPVRKMVMFQIFQRLIKMSPVKQSRHSKRMLKV